MLQISIPGRADLRLEHLVMDYNGTLACDGLLLPGVRECMEALSDRVRIHVLTADTFGKARAGLEGLPCELSILPPENQDKGKLAYVKRLGAAGAVCVGNGRNDMLMLKAAALGIAVVQEEGASVQTAMAADVICPNISSALQLLTSPLRLTATLRR